MRTVLLLLLALLGARACGEELDSTAPAPAPNPDLEADLVAFEKRTWPRPPAFGEPVPGRAWDHYRKAFDALDQAESAMDPEVLGKAREALDAWRDEHSPILPQVRPLVEAAAPAFALLEKGARTREAGRYFDLRLGVGLGVDDDPNDRAWKVGNRLKQLLRARQVVLVENHQLEAALEDILVLDRFGEDFRCGAPVIHHLVGIAMRRVAH
ncbi:MAG: hypothetical protein ACYTDY_20225, partial [Planctomycetota bacterium]